MVDDHIINLVIRLVLDHDVSPGDHAGQSGNLAYVSYTVKNVIKNQVGDNITELICHYEKDIVSEFTLEPDNPPYKYYYEKKITVNLCNEGKKEKVADKESYEKKINLFIENYLLRIEQDYGDNRAPVRFPPYYFYESPGALGSRCYCFIDVDLGENETLAFVSDSAEKMLEAVKKNFSKRFGFKTTPDNL